ncbi:MAG: peptidoglycan-binding protein [Leptolyngbyaceae cyanobacterium SM2_3_12]|nr:peptidoglycan-binding protein [Leptolyngbyaceae cyanobacterium SM2_3_12]
MEGEAVKQLQQRLQSLGLYSGPVDGLFGSQTEAAVRQVQRINNLTVDGIVGPATWAVLR